MPMAVMDIRKVRMFVGQSRMSMKMLMRLATVPAGIMRVLVMRVVKVRMAMFK